MLGKPRHGCSLNDTSHSVPSEQATTTQLWLPVFRPKHMLQGATMLTDTSPKPKARKSGVDPRSQALQLF